MKNFDGTGSFGAIFCDGKTVVPMVSAQDHKGRLFDKGLNTGGMGTFSPSRIYTKEVAAKCMGRNFVPTVAAMANEGRPFVGYFIWAYAYGKGMKVIEYNARFGDPEHRYRPRLKTDLLEIMEACVEGRLNELISNGGTPCVVLASAVSGKYEKGYEITGLTKLKTRRHVFRDCSMPKRWKLLQTAAGFRITGIEIILTPP